MDRRRGKLTPCGQCSINFLSYKVVINFLQENKYKMSKVKNFHKHLKIDKCFSFYAKNTVLRFLILIKICIPLLQRLVFTRTVPELCICSLSCGAFKSGMCTLMSLFLRVDMYLCVCVCTDILISGMRRRTM